MMLPATTPTSWRPTCASGSPRLGRARLISSLERVAAGGVRTGRAGPPGRTGARGERDRRAAGRQRPRARDPRDGSLRAARRGASARLSRARACRCPRNCRSLRRGCSHPLIAHDRADGTGHSGDLVRVLAAALAHPANRSLAAQRARLSRSVFYQRIALIEELLGVDLTDGETTAEPHCRAARARRALDRSAARQKRAAERTPPNPLTLLLTPPAILTRSRQDEAHGTC